MASPAIAAAVVTVGVAKAVGMRVPAVASVIGTVSVAKAVRMGIPAVAAIILPIGIAKAIGMRVKAVTSIVIAIGVSEAISLSIPAVLRQGARSKTNTHRNRKNNLLHFPISNLSSAVRGSTVVLDVISIGIGGRY